MNEIISAALAAIILACCMFTLYTALTPIIREEDTHDDLEN